MARDRCCSHEYWRSLAVVVSSDKSHDDAPMKAEADDEDD